MNEKQPKALECAEDLAVFMRYLERTWGDDYDEFRTLTESEKELRRLHEVNADLLNAAKLFIKYDSNQDDGVGMMIAYNDAIEATKAAVKKSTKDTK